jgi:hypothetical protein
MKRVWKPLDVGGQRLYEVYLYRQIKGKQGQHVKTYVVAADSPSNAAKLIEERHEESLNNNPEISEWYVQGFALNILQPEEWWESGPPDGYCEQCRKWSLRVINGELICSNEKSRESA